MEWVTANWKDVALVLTTAVALAAHIAALTPSPEDDKAVSWLRKVLDIVGGNYFNAKNKP